MSLQVFQYNDMPITFQDGANLFVNATDMAKPFGKKANDYMRLDSTKEFIAAYMSENSKAGNPVLENSLIQVVQGGANPGTWMHEDIALDFAAWLSPKFRVWLNARIKELMKYGVTATEEMLNNPDVLIKALEQIKIERAEKDKLRAEKEFIDQQLQLADKTIQAQAPKVEYYNKVLQAQNLITTNVIAMSLGVSAIKLNEILQGKKIIYKQSGRYLLHAQYRNAGLGDYKTHTYKNSEGQEQTSHLLCWTEAGRKFIIDTVKAPGGC